jgi:hypothetical protein
MDPQNLAPPINFVGDFQSLHVSIVEDKAGDKTRSMLEYLKQAELRTREMELRTQDYEQKQFARLLHEAFGASTRIVSAAWQKAHGADLVV